MTEVYNPNEYFVRMAKKHGTHWRALFIMPNVRKRGTAMRALFNLLEDAGISTTIHKSKNELATTNGAKALFKVAYKGLILDLMGQEFQQIDGTEILTEDDEEHVRPLLRTHVSLALAQDMIIR